MGRQAQDARKILHGHMRIMGTNAHPYGLEQGNIENIPLSVKTPSTSSIRSLMGDPILSCRRYNKPELWISSLKTGVKGDQVPFKSLLRHSKAVADGGILGATAPNPPLLASAYP